MVKFFAEGKIRVLSLNIQIEKFEGPLALLLHLIRKEEMDIFDINVHHITTQYLAYIKVMKQLDLEVAGEFVAMAATLIHIKSKMLLPQYDEDGEEIEVDDPRKELVQKLIDYQKYKEASEKLYARTLVGRDVWLRGMKEDFSGHQPEEEIVIEDNPLFSLIAAYRWSLKNMKKTVHRVMGELQSISERVLEMRDRLIPGRTVKFYQLIDATGEYKQGQVLMTFLSMLELAKIGLVSLFQSDNFSEIHVTTKRQIDHNVLDSVEDYESNVSGGLQDQASLFDSPQPKQLSIGEELQQEMESADDEPESINSVNSYAADTPTVFVKEEDQPLEEEIASDEDILLEEQRLNLKGQEGENNL